PDRGQLIAAMRRLSGRTQRYPSLAYGRFADIYKMVSGGQELCYKVIRVYQKTKVEHLAKVYAREAILWGQLSHPNILPFYGLLKYRSRIAFVSCWASNGNLEDYLTEHPEANRILLCSDTAAGVEYLHRNDIVHGDLKGLNVLIDGSGRASLGDFGISSVTDPQILRWTSQSTVASTGGTTRWQAPELLVSEDKTKKIRNSKASDVFAWASVCYEIFTGCLPFHEATNHATVVLNTARGDIPTCPPDGDPAWTKHGLNNRIWQLMRDCWHFEPERRPDIATVNFRLSSEKPVDLRSTGEWEKAAMRFRIAQDEALAKDLQPFWEEMESLLSRVVPNISGE
ncbi:Serine/threonine-protein kinase HT1, partial [Termitomyces sp. J132]